MPKNKIPAYLAHDLDRLIRSYTSSNQYDFNPGIAYPVSGEDVRFEIKHVMPQMVQNARQSKGHPHEDPHDHIRNFYSICASFNMLEISRDELHFVLFLFTLCDDAKLCANSSSKERQLHGMI